MADRTCDLCFGQLGCPRVASLSFAAVPRGSPPIWRGSGASGGPLVWKTSAASARRPRTTPCSAFSALRPAIPLWLLLVRPSNEHVAAALAGRRP